MVYSVDVGWKFLFRLGCTFTVDASSVPILSVSYVSVLIFSVTVAFVSACIGETVWFSSTISDCSRNSSVFWPLSIGAPLN